ncbi:MAG: MarR family transcriptional regulator [Micromonosporaceae bacterium]|nr:MarR family transcriptional regulator [Micromonosporaceae bacterium]
MSRRDRLDDDRITAVGLFAEAYAGIAARFAAHLAEHDLAPIEFEVLLRLARSPESRLRMTDLSAQTTLTTSGVTRVVDRLERDRLVHRLACSSDRRSLYAVLTAAGHSRLDAVLPGHLALIDETFTGLFDCDQLAAFLKSLRMVRDAVRPCAEAGTDAAADTPAEAGSHVAEPQRDNVAP